MSTQHEGGYRPAPRRTRGQAGFGLLEAVVSLALVSTVILALAGGLLTSVKASTSAKATQQVDAALSAYAESFKGVPFDPSWDPCPSTESFEGASTEPDWFATEVESSEVTKTEGWDEVAAEWFECDPSAPAPGSVRLTVEVTVQTNDGPRISTGQVVVRRDA